MRPITPTRSPPATSTTSQSPITGSPEALRASTVSSSAHAAVGTAAKRASPGTKPVGTSRKSAVATDGRAITASAMSSRLVTQRPQGRAVGRAELRKDSLVEDDGDQGDEYQVERDSELDRNSGTA